MTAIARDPLTAWRRASRALAPAGPADRGDARAPSGATLAERCGWSLVWFGVLVGGVNVWMSWSSWAPVAWVAPLLVLAGVVGMIAEWALRSPQRRAIQLGAMGLATAATAIPQAINIHLRQFYSTDSAAFDHLAGQYLLAGRNPYTTSMARAAEFFEHPAHNWTYTLSGGHVTAVSYPAGSFLFQVPALALGFHHATVDWMDLYAWLVAAIIVFLVLPASLRWVAGLIVLTPVFAAIFGSGGTDAAFVPFLVVAVFAWDRFAHDRGPVRFIGPICLGLACSIKQTPWFCVPILVTGVVIEARRSGRRPGRTAASYLVAVGVAFAAVNAPFIVAAPRAWVHGTLLPLATPLVSDGQGLVTLATHGIVRSVSLPMLSAAGLLVYAAIVAAFACWYRPMKRAWLFVVPLTFFVTPRSLSSYLIDLVPAAIVAAVSVAPAAPGPAGRGRRLLLARLVAPGALGLCAVIVCALAFVSPALQVRIASLHASRNGAALQSVTVRVKNLTAAPVEPHFMVVTGNSHPDGFWTPVGHRRLVIGPGGQTTVKLEPPTHFVAAPAAGSHWLVAAYSASPASMTASPVQFWDIPLEIPPGAGQPVDPWQLSPAAAATAHAAGG